MGHKVAASETGRRGQVQSKVCSGLLLKGGGKGVNVRGCVHVWGVRLCEVCMCECEPYRVCGVCTCAPARMCGGVSSRSEHARVSVVGVKVSLLWVKAYMCVNVLHMHV